MRVKQLLTAMAGAMFLASIGVANARELQNLTDTQLDAVTAGLVLANTDTLVNVAVQRANLNQINTGLVAIGIINQSATQVNVATQLNICAICR
jgi:hypothetical protein